MLWILWQIYKCNLRNMYMCMHVYSNSKLNTMHVIHAYFYLLKREKAWLEFSNSF